MIASQTSVKSNKLDIDSLLSIFIAKQNVTKYNIISRFYRYNESTVESTFALTSDHPLPVVRLCVFLFAATAMS